MQITGILSVTIFVSQEHIDIMHQCLCDLETGHDIIEIQPKYSEKLAFSLSQYGDQNIQIQISRSAFVMLNQLCRLPKLNTVEQESNQENPNP